MPGLTTTCPAKLVMTVSGPAGLQSPAVSGGRGRTVERGIRLREGNVVEREEGSLASLRVKISGKM